MRLDAVWADDFHHAVRRRLAGDSHGYYRAYAGVGEEIAATIRAGWLVTPTRGTDPSRVPMHRFVVCLQNHDQVGNRALGDRLHHHVDAPRWRAATVLLLTTPMTPLLFMGQEWAASTPFQFFTDMPAALGACVTEGRRLEFAEFPAFAEQALRESIPDPQALSTFEASRLRWDERERPPHRQVLDLYRALIDLRRREPALGASQECAGEATAPDEDTVVMRRRGADRTFWIVARLTQPGAVVVRLTSPADVALTSEDAAFAPDPTPPVIERGAAGTTIRFQRAGAVILKAGNVDGNPC
jgi:maltooligosyltrehalose trehalohydrolase